MYMNEDWYINDRWVQAPKHVVSAAVAVVNDEKELLLIRSPIRGWEIPGGQVELGESLREAAIREVKEESGILIEILEFCGIFQSVNRSICNLLFSGRPISGVLTTSSESIEVGWFSLPDALEKIEYGNFRQRVSMILEAKQKPFLVEVNV